MPRRAMTAVLAIAGLLAIASGTRLSSAPARERFFADSVAGLRNPRSGLRIEPVEVAIERWSTVAEREQIAKAFGTGREGEVKHALAAIRSPVGYVYFRGDNESIGRDRSRYDLKYASDATAESGERRIVLITEAPQGPVEVIEIRFPAGAVGEGRMARGIHDISAAKDTQAISVTSYKEAAVCLKNVRRQ